MLSHIPGKSRIPVNDVISHNSPSLISLSFISIFIVADPHLLQLYFIIITMARGIRCRQVLPDSAFDYNRRGTLQKTCRQCLVRYPDIFPCFSLTEQRF